MRPTSATGATRPRPSPGRLRSAACRGGFTLVEVLVVVAIAGVLLVVASVNLFPSPRENARREAAMVALALEHARDAAWFGGRPTAVTLGDGRVREWRLAAESWVPAAGRERALGMEVAGLFVDGQPLPRDERLVFLPDGFGIPFRVALRSGGGEWSVQGDASGGVRVVEP